MTNLNIYQISKSYLKQLMHILQMPLDERKLRMNQLKKRERRMDVDSWVESFLVGMEDISQGELIRQRLLRKK